MDPDANPPRNGTGGPAFPKLPILSTEPPRRSQREKYGGLFYLGLLGLAAVLGLVGWFIQGAWSHRDIWTNVYVLHDESRPEPERIRAALLLSRDPRVNDRQRWDMSFRRQLPALARYLLARSFSAEAASADPRAYAMAVARSPDWPGWLRLLLTRAMAYAAVEGIDFPREPILELTQRGDQATALWAWFVLAERDADREAALASLAKPVAGAAAELGALLLEAARLHGNRARQRELLDRASGWIDDHPAEVGFASSWKVEEDRIVPKPAPELH